MLLIMNSLTFMVQTLAEGGGIERGEISCIKFISDSNRELFQSFRCLRKLS